MARRNRTTARKDVRPQQGKRGRAQRKITQVINKQLGVATVGTLPVYPGRVA